jgi:hypothetical protein
VLSTRNALDAGLHADKVAVKMFDSLIAGGEAEWKPVTTAPSEKADDKSGDKPDGNK